MAQGMMIEVLDRQGWRKEVPLQKGIVHIGSDPRNDVLLEPARGTGVDLLHAQLISVANGSGFQLVNLGDQDIWLGQASDQVVAPRTAVQIADGAVFKVGEFRLILHASGSASGGLGGAAPHIGLSVLLPQHRLVPNRSLEGAVRVTNRGDRTGAQFNLDLEGFEAGCFEIEPGPILSSGAEKEVSFRLHHRGNKPLAGEVTVTIRASAPQAYPGEEVSVTQTVQVLPLYRHQLRLVSPSRALERQEEPPASKAEPAPPAKKEEAPPEPAPAPSQERARAGTGTASDDWWSAPPGSRPARRHVPPAAATPPEPSPVAPAAPERPAAEAARGPDGAAPQPAAEGAGGLEAAPPTAPGEPAPEPPAREGEPGAETAVRPPAGQAVSEPPAAGAAEPVAEPAAAPEGGALRPPAPVEPAPSGPPGPAAADWWGATEPEPPPPPPPPPPPRAPAAGDWWAPPAEPAEEEVKAQPGVIKLKASRPSEAEPTPAAAPPPAGDWWATQSGATPGQPRVIKLKARPAAEPQPGGAPATPAAAPARAEDWWTPQPAAGSEQPPDAPSDTEDS